MAGFRASERMPGYDPVTLERSARPEAPSGVDVMVSAFNRQQTLASWMSEDREEFAPVPGYFPLDDVQGYEDYGSRLAYVSSPDEMDQAKRNIDREQRDQENLRLAGGWGTVAEITASIADPVNLPMLLVPPAAMANGLRGVAGLVALATTEVAVQEGALQATQYTRTSEETAVAILGTALLSGVLGGAAYKYGKRAIGGDNFDEAAAGKDLVDDIDGTLVAPGLSAQRALGREQISLEDQVRGKTFGLKDARAVAAFAAIAPGGRTANSPSPQVSRISAGLSENSYQWVGETRGEASRSAVETWVKRDKDLVHGLNYKVMTEDYLAYRKTGGELEVEDFLSDVGVAIWRGDSANTAVRNAAQRYINVLEGDDIGRQALLRVGLVNEAELASGVKIDENYLHRMYDKDFLIANPEKFINYMTEYIMRVSETRLRSQEGLRVKQLGKAQTVVEDTASKTAARVAKAEESLAAKKQALKDADPAAITDARRATLAKDVSRAEARLAKARRQSKKRTAKAQTLLSRVVARGKAPLDVVVRVDAQDAARDIHMRIVNGDSASMEWQDVVGKAGPLHQRAITAPSAEMAEEGFLITNVADIMDNYTRRIAPQIRITERFGDPDMKTALANVKEEFSALIAAAPTAKEKAKLNKTYVSNRDDLEAMRDILRGTFGLPSAGASTAVELGRNWRALEALNSLGGILMASLGDMAIPVARHGLSGHWKGLTAMMKDSGLHVEAAQRAGGAMDNILHNRGQDLMNPGEYHGTRNQKLRERAMGRFMKHTGLSWWNTRLKAFVGALAQDKMLRYSQDLSGHIEQQSIKVGAGDVGTGYAFKSTADPRRVAELEDLGVDAEMARSFAAQPVNKGDVWTADIDNWTDRAAVNQYQVNMVRHMDTNVLVPGIGDLPLWSRSEFGKLIFLFKSFAMSSVQRLLVPMIQRRDFNAVLAFSGTLSLAVIGNTLRELGGGKSWEETSIVGDRTKAVADALSYSGFVGTLMEPVNQFRYFRGGSPIAGLAGPALGGGLRDIPRAASIPLDLLTTGEISKSDIKATRRLIPYQNLIGFDRAVDAVEQGIIDATGAR